MRTTPSFGIDRQALASAGSPAAARSTIVSAGKHVRRLGIRAQLALFSVLLVLVAAGGTSYAGWLIVDGLIQQGNTNRLNAAAATFASLYNQRASDAEIVTRQLSERANVVGLIQRRATEQLTTLLEPVQSLRPIYSIVVADTDAAVLAKVIPPGRSEERRVGKECRSRWSRYP